MEEKKAIKISLSTVLLFVAILVIAFMAYYIYTERTNYNKEILSLKDNIDNLQNVVNDLNEDTIINNTQTSSEKKEFKEGTYAYRNSNTSELFTTENKIPYYYKKIYIKFYDSDKFIIFHPHLDNTGTIFGNYEKNSNDIIRCIISDDYNFEMKVVNKNNLQIVKVNDTNTEEGSSEFDIILRDLTSKGQEYIRFEKSDIVGKWNVSAIFKDISNEDSGDYWKTEDYTYEYNITFYEDGTFEEYNEERPDGYREIKGEYETESGNIYLSNNVLGLDEMVIIDSNTILYETSIYKFILTKD